MAEIDIVKKKEPEALKKAVAHGKRGDNIVYWRGVTCGGPHRYPAVSLLNAGKVALVQRRVERSKGLFDYIAQIL